MSLKLLYDGQAKTSSATSNLVALAIDIIAVPGIGADPDKTWCRNGVNWLSDERMLPNIAPISRIYCFAYESRWLGKNLVSVSQGIQSVAEQLLHALNGIRISCRTRPILFIGHCFGGLVIEKAILSANMDSEAFPSTFNATLGVIFFGTPHRGSDQYSLAHIIGTIASFFDLGQQSRLIELVDKDSEWLYNIFRDFVRTANIASISLFCFHELWKSDLAKILNRATILRPTYNCLVVDECSACIDGFPKLGLKSDHFNLQKFSGPEDENYLQVLSVIVSELEKYQRKLSRSTETAAQQNKPLHRRDLKILNRALQEIFITNPVDDMSAIESNKDRVIIDLGQWLYSSSSYSSWLNKSISSILWLHGGPGKGKTMLAISTVKELNRKIANGPCQPQSELLYFFCDSADNQRKTSISILRGLIYHILYLRPEYSGPLRKEFETQGDKFLASPNLFAKLWRIFQNIIDSSSLDTVYVVLDGLDECDNSSTMELLESLKSSNELRQAEPNNEINGPEGSRCRIKYFLTSRNETYIRESLNSYLQINLEDESSRVGNAVNHFIDAKVEELTQTKSYTAEDTESVRKELYTKSGGTFLWVSLACKELSRPGVWAVDAKKVLSALPEGLPNLYNRILSQILNLGLESNRAIAIKLIQTLAIVKRPLTFKELILLNDIPMENGYDGIRVLECIELCGSLVASGGYLVRLVHLSAQEYIATRSDLFPAGLPDAHANLAKTCLQYLSIADWPNDWDDDEFDVVEYPSILWIDHIREAGDRLDDYEFLNHPFFKELSTRREAWYSLYQEFVMPNYFTFTLGTPTALQLAVLVGRIRLVRTLLEGNSVEINALNDNGETALAWAIYFGSTEIVELLIQCGADINLEQKIDQVYVKSNLKMPSMATKLNYCNIF